MLDDLALFLLAGIAGGAVNTAAGGAKLFVFPILLASGIPPVSANATGTIALWPAQLPAVYVFRDRLAAGRAELFVALLPALVGGVCGALTLIWIGERAFVALIPLFLAAAVTAIAFGDRLARLAARVAPVGRKSPPARALFFAVGFYGGFFGAGMGFMLLAVLTLAGVRDIHLATAEKNLFATAINTVAVVPLALSGLIDWVAAVVVLIGGLAGGYLGARITGVLPAPVLRVGVVILGVALTVSFLSGR